MERWNSSSLATMPGVSRKIICVDPSVRIPTTLCHVVCAFAVTMLR